LDEEAIDTLSELAVNAPVLAIYARRVRGQGSKVGTAGTISTRAADPVALRTFGFEHPGHSEG